MPLWERLMDLADTVVSSKTQCSRMSDGAAAISLLFAESSLTLFPAQKLVSAAPVPVGVN